MTFYPTTDLPSYPPPYKTFDDIIASLCNNCLEVSDAPNAADRDIEQIFDYTMALIEFWYIEFHKEGLYVGSE